MNAGVAQQAEQPLRKRQVAGSSPAAGSLIGALERFLEATRRSRRERELVGIIETLRRRLAQIFGRQAALFGEGVGQALYPGQTPATSAFAGPLEAGIAAGAPLMASAIQTGVEAAMLAGMSAAVGDLGGIGIAFDLHNPRAVAYLREYGAARVTQISSATRQEMQTLIANMVDDGSSYDQIAREIKRRWQEMSIGKPQQHIASRAHLIAVTEAGNAYEHGNLVVVQDMSGIGIQMEKFWQTVGDDRVSDGCAQNEGVGWIPVDEAFPSGDDSPLRFPGCRCTALYRRAGSGANENYRNG